jgi:hypothetical protein
VSAWRERRRLAAGQAGTTISPAEDGSPLTTAKMTGAELLRSLRAEADRITALGAGLRDRIDTLTDPTAGSTGKGLTQRRPPRRFHQSNRPAPFAPACG